MSLDILDQSVAALKQMLPNCSLGELEALREAEQNGKTRKGAIEAIDEAIAAIEAEPEDVPAEEPDAGDPCTVTNILPGTTLHLGDGRKLAFGESAQVPEDLAAFLRERGQAE